MVLDMPEASEADKTIVGPVAGLFASGIHSARVSPRILKTKSES